MRLDYLGHAGWLLEASGLRVLFDPILFDQHAGGVFQVVPRRTIDPAALRPDFVVVSHAHFDHFDIDSLDALAQFDPDSVLITSDALVAEASSALGFKTVRRVDPGTKIALDGGLSLTTTPSRAPDIEWGVLIADESGTAWNMIDTVFQDESEVRRVAEAALAGRDLDLALAPIQPMREIALATADYVGFDVRDYAHYLAAGVASSAKVVAPSACGEAFRPPYDALNAWVYPVSRARAVRDLARFAPSLRALDPQLGDALLIEGGEVTLGPGTVAMDIGDRLDPRSFRPLVPAPLVDPNLDARPVVAMRARISDWVRGELAGAIVRELGDQPALASLSLALEVVFEDDVAPFRFDVRGHVEERSDPEYDVLVMVAGSMLDDVIAGRRAWVEPLLAGLLRSSVRGAQISDGRCGPLSVAPIFLYYAIPYRASVERAVNQRVAAKLAARRGTPR